MTEDEYLAAFRKIDKEAQEAKFDLKKLYIKQNNPYNIGDIISDHYKTIKIEGISGISMQCGSIIPVAVYRGVVLKKDGNPAKNQSDNQVFATNIIQ